jgi:hypothetical protein
MNLDNISKILRKYVVSASEITDEPSSSNHLCTDTGCTYAGFWRFDLFTILSYNTSMKIKKLTRQYSGYGTFTHVVEYTKWDILQFNQHRQWCWDTWGASCELDFSLRLQRQHPDKRNEKWSWLTNLDVPKIRIYFASEQEASHFLLKWS